MPNRPARSICRSSRRASRRLLPTRLLACLLLTATASCEDAAAPSERKPSAKTVLAHKGGITRYVPSRAANGATLDLDDRRRATLVDMNGRTLRRWPAKSFRDRVRLLNDCSVLGISRGDIEEVDWDGNVTWRYDLVRAFAHHDVIRLANGNTLFVLRRFDAPTDDIREVDRAGAVVWEWQPDVHMGAGVKNAVQRGKKDITHINSVQELPKNPWFDAGDTRFRPGNILVSARNLDTVFIIDKQTMKVVWKYSNGLERQHEALMLLPGFDGHGNIMIFNNRDRRRRTEVIQVDPVLSKVVWRYESDRFWSRDAGTAQPLPNGNVLITSSRGGRVFEVTPGRDTVWERVVIRPVRATRYPYDHCAELAALARSPEQAVSSNGYEHVDIALYEWTGTRTIRAGGRRLRATRTSNMCRRVTVPNAPTLDVRFGVLTDQLPEGDRDDYAFRFSVHVGRGMAGPLSEIYAETIDESGPTRRQSRIDLVDYQHERVKLCVAVSEPRIENPRPNKAFAYWRPPRITSRNPPARERLTDSPDVRTREELEVDRRQLEALGYID